MDNSKNTKKALLASVLSLVLCCAMLIGTTYAWFTDSASVGVNKIVSGTLDVELLMSGDGLAWTSAEGETLSFIKAAGAENEAVLWEPGSRYMLPQLKIRNNGNLALKYVMVINAVAGDTDLAEVIDVYTGYGTAEQASLGTLRNLINNSDEIFFGHLLAGDETDPYELTFVMQTSAGNEYQGKSIENISVTILATQYTY